MALSSQEKLERLFAFMPRPERPPVGTPVLFEREMAVRSHQPQAHVAPTTAIEPNHEPHSSPQTTHDTGHAQVVLTDSDDGDDYTSAFPSSNHNAKDPATIEFVAHGKKPSTKNAGKAKYQDRSSTNASTIWSHIKDANVPSTQFCCFWPLSRFPYKYMKDQDDRVSKEFFAQGKFFERSWDLYYLNPPASLGGKPLILVPIKQARELIDAIADKFSIAVSVPSFPFTVPFYGDGTPEPVFLGKSSDRERVNSLIAGVPDSEPDFGESPEDGPMELQERFEAWHEKFQRAQASGGKAKSGASSASKAKARSKKYITIFEKNEQLKRAQQYLGLRPRTLPASAPPDNIPWDEIRSWEKDQLRDRGLVLDFLDAHQPAPFPLVQEPVIICIDVESDELNHSTITEIGVSTLDTLDLANIPPGPQGENWTKHIRSRHFRIRGTEHIRNRRWCIGHPEAFRFGASEWVQRSEASMAVDNCFQWPFSLQYKHRGVGKSAEGVRSEQTSTSFGLAHQHELSPAEISSLQRGGKDRNIVFLGHDTSTDAEYLQRLGSEIFSSLRRATAHSECPESDAETHEARHHILGRILESLDTAIIDNAIQNTSQNRSLQTICTSLEIDCAFAHNGGNDARYTLEAFVRLALKARLAEDEATRKAKPHSTVRIIAEREAEAERQAQESLDQALIKLRAKLATRPAGDKMTDVSSDPHQTAEYYPVPEHNPNAEREYNW